MKTETQYYWTACIHRLLIVLITCLSGALLSAQGTIQSFVGSDAQHYYDITAPATGYIFLELKGADGGDSRDTPRNGGEGAKTTCWVTIGNGAAQVPPGATLRLIPGQKGGSTNLFGVGNGYGSGGGGTAVAFKGPNATDSWQLVAVAGGGGGAGKSYSGRTGTNTTDGTNGQGANGYGNNNHGTNGNAASYTSSDAGEGAGAYSGGTDDDGRAGIQNGQPVGGAGGTESGGEAGSGGGFGFGGGGAGMYMHNFMIPDTYAGGGGGGYSGGGAGSTNGGGGGGGSFANADYVILPQIESFSATSSPKDGYVRYYFTESSPVKSILLAKDQTKCIDDYGAQTGNGTNIQLYHCHEHPAQLWVIDGSIKLYKDLNKCIDLSNGATTNSNNIQLWDCSAGNHNQVWIYDVINQSIRSGVDFNKCMDLDHGNTADGSNIRIWDCNNTDSQKWSVDSIPTSLPTGNKNTIHMAAHPDKCVDITHSSILNGTNIQLWDCNGTAAQQFTFEGRNIKLIQMIPNKCIDLTQSGVANGTNIQLYDCNGTKAQEWIYDGFSNAFRSAVNINKCLDISAGNTANGTNIQLWDCQAGNTNQQFLIED